MKRFILLGIGLLFWMTGAVPALADDSKMTHLVFRFADPDVAENHFALKPRKMWRLGTRYFRMEEPPDPERGIHGLVIIDEPHAFMINRYNNRGMHMIDPGPTFIVHSPIFQYPKESEISKLEFGREVEFFERHNAQPMPDVNRQGKRYRARLLEIDEATLILFTDETSGHPALLTLESQTDAYQVHYETYETGLEPDMGLFKVPAGVKISEAGEHPAP